MMTEAAICMPVAILTAMLLLRMFVFSLQVLTAGIEEHREALKAQKDYRGAVMQTYGKERSVTLLHGGLLSADASKKISVKAYMINEDLWVRGSELFGQ